MTTFRYRSLSNPKPARQEGLSLIELMVGLVIGLLVTLVVYNVLVVNEGRKRTTTSLNDINQAGNYLIYQLEKEIRSAGSGFTAGLSGLKDTSASGVDIVAADNTYGCALSMALSGALLAPATAFPAPFNLVSTSIKVAPVIIYAGAAGAGGDVIVTMAGNAGLGEAPISFPDTPTAAAVNLSNHAGVRANDILLLTDISPPSVAGVVDITAVGVAPCLMEQVDSTFIPIAGDNKIVPLAGKYYLATIDGHSATDYTSDSSSKQVINLGASPNLNMYAVGPNNTLMKYDLMQNLQSNSTLANANPGIYVDGVYQMKALYGVGPAPLTWFAPTGAFSAASLLTGTAAAKKNLKSIKAIKVGVVMRTSLLERETVNASSLILFSDTGLPVTVDLSPTTFRYRSFEAVIPLRNPLMLK